VRSRARKPPTGAARLLAATSFATLALGAGLAQAQTTETTTSTTTSTTSESTTDATTAAEEQAAAAGSGGVDPSGGLNTGSDPSTSDPTAGEETTASTSGGGNVELLLANAKPRKAFVLGDPAVFHYAISNSSASDLKVQFVNRKTGEVVRSVDQSGIAPKEEQSVKWKGENDDGKLAKTGEYKIRVTSSDGEKADVSRAKGKRKAGLYLHKYPVRGKHSYGDGIGAPRDGHTHQGQDVFADCGTRLVAATAGKVQHKAYHSAAGYYVVIDGKKSSFDYVYMHLKDKAKVSEGEKVKTGEKIGRVGDSGNASGCHLHFELWTKPGWYEGGNFSDKVTKKLKKWDRYS
jgi:murein DD-endopeptidase MepM/ murein hydrolase activator NlpD